MGIYQGIILTFYQLPDNHKLLVNHLEKPMRALLIQIKKQLEFVIDLTANTYSNYSAMEICVPIRFMKKSNKAQQMDANMTTVNNFGPWFTILI